MLQIISYIGTLIIGCIISTIQNKYRGEILYLCRTETLVLPVKIGIQDIQILYKKQPISTLSVSKLLLVNNSQHIVKKSDIAKNEFYISISKGNKILRIDCINNTDTKNIYNLSISENQEKVFIKFHYLNPGDSWLFQIFHTSQYSQDIQCTCCGAGITNTKRISILCHPWWEIAFLLFVHFVVCTIFIVIGLELCEKAGFLQYLCIFPWFLTILFVISFVKLCELDYRFTGWYKFAQKNGF